MSKQRQKDRLARQEARRREVQAAELARERQARRRAFPTLRRSALVRAPKRRRYGALPMRVRFQLITAFVVAQVLTWWLVPSLGARLSLAVLTLAVLLVLATTRRSTPR